MAASIAVEEEGPNHDLHPREIFQIGTLIEVATVEDGFSDSWYVATVIEPPSPLSPKKRKGMTSPSSADNYYVEYVTLVDDDDEVSPLKEFVDAELVRPVPPPPTTPPPPSSFRVNDVVDAFYHDGWWTGVITAVLPDYRFMVAFQKPPDLIEFGFSDLRVHLEWIGGTWVKPEPTKEHSQSGSPENSLRKRRGRPPGLVRPSSRKLKIPLSNKDKPAALSKELEKPSPTKGGQMSANSPSKSPSNSTADDSSGALM